MAKKEEKQPSAKDLKKLKVKEYTEKVKEAEAVFLAGANLTANEAVELKKKLSEHDGEYHVVKNRLFSIALDNAVGDKPEIKGFTGVVFAKGDPVAAAKSLYEVMKEGEGEVKFGYYGGERIEAEKVKELSELPGFEELVSKLAYMTAYPIKGLMNVLQAPVRDFTLVLQAIKDQKEATA